LLLASAFFLGCIKRSSKPLDDYGLVLVEIIMDSEQLSRLNSTVWDKLPIPCKVIIDGQTFSAHVTYAGKSTIDDLKKSYKIRFDSGRYRGHKEYRISAQSLDPTLLKSHVGFDIFRALELPTPDIDYASVYLNKDFTGLFQLIEPVDAAFFERRHLSYSSLFKAQYGNADFNTATLSKLEQGFDVQSDPESYHELIALIETLNSKSKNKKPADLENMVDIDNSIRYLVASVILNNWDGYQNNFFIFRDLESKKFGFVPWDLDRVLEPDASKLLTPNASIWGENKLIAALLENPTHKKEYLDLLEQTLSKTYPLAKMLDIIEETSSKVRPAFEADRMLSRKFNFQAEKEKLKLTATSWVQLVEEELKRQKQSIVVTK
jgi:spore coat protein H